MFSPTIKRAMKLYEMYENPVSFSEMEKHSYSTKGRDDSGKGDELNRFVAAFQSAIREEYSYRNKVRIVSIYIKKLRPEDDDLFDGRHVVKLKVLTPEFKKHQEYYITKYLFHQGLCYRQNLDWARDVLKKYGEKMPKRKRW